MSKEQIINRLESIKNNYSGVMLGVINKLIEIIPHEEQDSMMLLTALEIIKKHD